MEPGARSTVRLRRWPAGRTRRREARGGARVHAEGRSRPRGTIPLGRLGGVPVALHYTGLLSLLLFFWFSEDRLGRTLALAAESLGHSEHRRWLWLGLITLGLALGSLAHQGLHRLAARLVGGRMRPIVLGELGGCLRLDEGAPRWRRALVAAAGPLGLTALGLVLRQLGVWASVGIEVRVVLTYLGGVLAVLGVFHLLPVPPLDGGRVVAALAERRLGRARGLRLGGHMGRGLGLAAAVLGVLWGYLPLLVLAGVLWMGAEGALEVSRTEALCDLRVADLVEPPAWIDARTPLAMAAMKMEREGRLTLVVLAGAEVLGMLEAEDIGRIEAPLRRELLAGELVRPLPALPLEMRADRALGRMRVLHAPALAVVEAGVLVGLVSRSGLEHAARLLALAGAGRWRALLVPGQEQWRSPPRRRLPPGGSVWRRRPAHETAAACWRSVAPRREP